MSEDKECAETYLRRVSVNDALEFIRAMTRELTEMAEPTQISRLIYHLKAAGDICARELEEKLLDTIQTLHDEAFVVLPIILEEALVEDLQPNDQS